MPKPTRKKKQTLPPRSSRQKILSRYGFTRIVKGSPIPGPKTPRQTTFQRTSGGGRRAQTDDGDETDDFQSAIRSSRQQTQRVQIRSLEERNRELQERVRGLVRENEGLIGGGVGGSGSGSGSGSGGGRGSGSASGSRGGTGREEDAIVVEDQDEEEQEQQEEGGNDGDDEVEDWTGEFAEDGDDGL